MRNMVIQKGVKEVVGYVYQQGDLNLEYFQANRAQHGTNAHQAIQKKYLDEECEVYLEMSVKHQEHDVILSGRMDLLLHRDERIIIGEIKSTTRRLELIEENDRPVHYAQAKVYAYLYLLKHPELNSVIVRLIYCNLDGTEERAFNQEYTLDELEPFMNHTLEV